MKLFAFSFRTSFPFTLPLSPAISTLNIAGVKCTKVVEECNRLSFISHRPECKVQYYWYLIGISVGIEYEAGCVNYEVQAKQVIIERGKEIMKKVMKGIVDIF